METQKMTRVVFRAWKDGSVIALLPDVKWDSDCPFCVSYCNTWELNTDIATKTPKAASYLDIILETRPATPIESRPLHESLIAMGYKIEEIEHI